MSKKALYEKDEGPDAWAVFKGVVQAFVLMAMGWILLVGLFAIEG